MGKLSRGITFQTNSYVTQAKLHALIDSVIAAADAFPGAPTIYDIVMADLLTVRAFDVEDAPTAPATNDMKVGSDGFLDVYNGTAWQDITTDYIYLLNNSGITLATGNPVVGDPSGADKCRLWPNSGVCYEPLGVNVTISAPGATATIQVRGIAPVFVNLFSFPATDSHLRIPAAGATGLSSTTSVLSDVLGIVVATDANSSTPYMLAMLTH